MGDADSNASTPPDGVPALNVTGQGLDLAARARMASLRAAMFGVHAEPARLDRFVVLDTLGAGGMGVVYAAYDPRLDRRIALKLVKPGVAPLDPRFEARLLREAQAMARLSHPNVVQVHEVGVTDGRLFIAMELVVGRPLSTWLSGQARPWRDIVRVFSDAGRGLAAAHAVGIVHRDFKPENVLVGDDGRVRVSDFGLARGPEAPPTGRSAGDTDPLGALAAATPSIPGPGGGTPRYMSPEQFLGESVSPASDQFSFCVALYHALHGVSPFAGDDPVALAHAVLAGARREPPRLRIPRHLHRALIRGLARAPAERFPDMHALLARIEPRSPWRLAAPLGLVFAAAAAVALAREDDPCADTDAWQTGVWDDERRAAVEAAYAGSGLPDRALVWPNVDHALADYTATTAAMYTRSCQEHRRGEGSRALHDLRVDCLARRRDVVRGVVDILASGDVAALREAPEAVTRLDDLAACDDAPTLLLGVDPPAPALAEPLARLRREIDAARALELVGDEAASRAQIARTLAEARALDHAPTIAEALHQQGRLELLADDHAAAVAPLREALDLALGARHDALVTDVWPGLIEADAVARGEARGIAESLRLADAWQRRRAATPVQRAGLERARSLVREAEGDNFAAETAARRAAELKAEALGPDSLQAAIEREHHASLLDRIGRTDEAIALFRRSGAVIRGAVGAEHMRTATAEYNLAAALINVGDAAALAEAETLLRRSHALVRKLRGDRSLARAEGATALGRLAQLRGDIEQAERWAAEAVQVYALHPTHPDRAYALTFHGSLLFERERFDEALAAHTAARAAAREAWGETHYMVGAADSNIGDVLLARDELDAAIDRYTAAIPVLSDSLGPEAAELISPHLGRAAAHETANRPCQALADLGRAHALMHRHDADPAELTEVSEDRQKLAKLCNRSN